MYLNEYAFEQRVSSFMSGVYGWMCCALAITAGAAYYIASTPAIIVYMNMHPGMVIGLVVAQLAFVFALVFLLNRLSFVSALILFLLYALTVGVTLSSIFQVYTELSIISTFLTTALMFGVMSVYGYVTKSDLTSMGNMSIMVLVGLVIGMIINMFLKSAQFDYILSAIGVIVFVLLTAYDTQKIKQLARSEITSADVIGKVTIVGALTLYLDFINLFLFLLRFMGKRQEN